MVSTINIYEAKTHLSRLVDRATAGEDIVIARAGKPLVRLVPVDERRFREGGQLKGLAIPDNAFDPRPDAGAPPEQQPIYRRPPPEMRGLPVPKDMFAPMSEEELADWE